MSTEINDGLDLKPVMEWFSANNERIQEQIAKIIVPTKSCLYDLKNIFIAGMTEIEVATIINLYPIQARNLSILQEISGHNTLWFKRGHTVAKPLTTGNIVEAMSPTHIIPGFAEHLVWNLTERVYKIELYKIPNVSESVEKAIMTYTLIHEFGHTILVSLWYTEKCILKFPTGRKIDGQKVFEEFAEMASKHEAISHYAAAYRPFPDISQPRDFYRCVSEELCDTFAAYLLEFIKCSSPERCFNPLGDRPEIREFVFNLLHAELVQ